MDDLQPVGSQPDQGFTLVELLVVIVIIGVLAAVAIPTFLAQRERAHDSATQVALKSLASAQEAYKVDNPLASYVSAADATALSSQLGPHSWRGSTGVVLAVNAGMHGYCAAAANVNSRRAYFYDSQGTALLAETRPASRTSTGAVTTAPSQPCGVPDDTGVGQLSYPVTLG